MGVTNTEIFVGASQFKDVAGLAALASGGAGLFAQTLAATQAGTFYADITAFLRAVGLFPTAGTGNAPLLSTQLNTVSGNAINTSGQAGKGLQINSIDVIYTATVANLTVATVGLTQTVFADTTAPAVTSLITLGANGLPVAFQVTPHLKNVVVASPAPIATTQTSIICNVNLTAGAGSTVTFYGVNLHCSNPYN